MRGLIQRVQHAKVEVAGETIGAIDQGILLLLGVQRDDDKAAMDKLLHKLLNYRIFPDADGKMNLSVTDVEGGILVVSQFTLAADTQKGLRPGFSTAAAPAQAEVMYDDFVVALKAKHSGAVATGSFGADMQVSLCNDGPVTFLLEA